MFHLLEEGGLLWPSCIAAMIAAGVVEMAAKPKFFAGACLWAASATWGLLVIAYDSDRGISSGGALTALFGGIAFGLISAAKVYLWAMWVGRR
jgi:hypothetical protein